VRTPRHGVYVILRAMHRLVALLVLAAVVCACGSRGALYLPPPQPDDDVSVPKSKRK
jgi:predicted small lipoprotein YifL